MTVNFEDPFAGIVECAAHTTAMDEDCEFCHAEFEAKNAISEEITQKVHAGVKDLAREGVQMPSGLVLSVRLELLIESILSDRNRLHFEVEVGRRLHHSVQETKKDVTRSKLAGNHPGSGGLQVVSGSGMPKRRR